MRSRAAMLGAVVALASLTACDILWEEGDQHEPLVPSTFSPQEQAAIQADRDQKERERIDMVAEANRLEPSELEVPVGLDETLVVRLRYGDPPMVAEPGWYQVTITNDETGWDTMAKWETESPEGFFGPSDDFHFMANVFNAQPNLKDGQSFTVTVTNSMGYQHSWFMFWDNGQFDSGKALVFDVP